MALAATIAGVGFGSLAYLEMAYAATITTSDELTAEVVAKG